LLAVAIMVPTYTLGQVRKTPLDLEITTVSNTPKGQGADVLDIASLTAPTGAAKVDTNVPLVAQRFITVEEPSGKSTMTLQAGVSIRRTDKQGQSGLVSAYVDKGTIDRKTGELQEDPVGSISVTGGAPAEAVPHTGWQYRYPFSTEKTTYPVFDVNARKAFDANFIEEGEINGTKAYHFIQKVPITDLSKVVKSSSNTVTLPAAKWGVEGTGDITMNRYYTNERDIWVEPKTGVVLKGSEKTYYYFARSADKPEVTVLKATVVVDEATIESQISKAKDAIDKISLYGRVLPLILGILGVIAIIAGVILGKSGGIGRGRSTANGAPDGPSDPPTDRFDLTKGDDSPTQIINP
jgi:hypothetical protein